MTCRKCTPPQEKAGGAAASAGFADDNAEAADGAEGAKARARLRKISAAFCSSFFFFLCVRVCDGRREVRVVSLVASRASACRRGREREPGEDPRSQKQDDGKGDVALSSSLSLSLLLLLVPPSFIYLGHIPQVVPSDDRVPSRGQDEELRDHLVAGARKDLEDATTTIDQIDGEQSINFECFPFSAPCLLVYFFPSSSFFQSVRAFTTPKILSSAATQRCTSTTAGRKSATVASPAARSRCGSGMRWPQTTVWSSLVGCFEDEKEERRDDRKEEEDEEDNAPAMSQAKEGRREFAEEGRRQEVKRRRKTSAGSFSRGSLILENREENEGREFFSLLLLSLLALSSDQTMFIIPAAATSCAASLAASCACWSAGALGKSIASRSARLAFVGFFSFSLALAWVLRLGAEPLVKHLPCE